MPTAVPAPESKTCSICLSNLDGHLFQLEGCKHEFHKTCLAPWAKDHPSCPLCRRNIVQTDQEALNPALKAMGMTPASHFSPQSRWERIQTHPISLDHVFLQIALMHILMDSFFEMEMERPFTPIFVDPFGPRFFNPFTLFVY